MSAWPAHPDDEWVDVTSLGDTAPHYALARSGAETVVNRARAAYIAGQIDVEELERRIDEAVFLEHTASSTWEGR